MNAKMFTKINEEGEGQKLEMKMLHITCDFILYSFKSVSFVFSFIH